jgi:hypothetical protein
MDEFIPTLIPNCEKLPYLIQFELLRLDINDYLDTVFFDRLEQFCNDDLIPNHRTKIVDTFLIILYVPLRMLYISRQTLIIKLFKLYPKAVHETNRKYEYPCVWSRKQT